MIDLGFYLNSFCESETVLNGALDAWSGDFDTLFGGVRAHMFFLQNTSFMSVEARDIEAVFGKDALDSATCRAINELHNDTDRGVHKYSGRGDYDFPYNTLNQLFWFSNTIDTAIKELLSDRFYNRLMQEQFHIQEAIYSQLVIVPGSWGTLPEFSALESIDVDFLHESLSNQTSVALSIAQSDFLFSILQPPELMKGIDFDLRTPFVHLFEHLRAGVSSI